VELSKPSPALARRLMSDLGWEDRLRGECYNQMAGNTQYFLYSLEEAANFLDGDADSLADRRNGAVCTIDPTELIAWTKKTLGDEELAAAIAATVEPLAACQDPIRRQHEEIALIQPLRELLLARVAQCRQALEGSAAGEDGREG
jgi:hypothetical protein